MNLIYQVGGKVHLYVHMPSFNGHTFNSFWKMHQIRFSWFCMIQDKTPLCGRQRFGKIGACWIQFTKAALHYFFEQLMDIVELLGIIALIGTIFFNLIFHLTMIVKFIFASNGSSSVITFPVMWLVTSRISKKNLAFSITKSLHRISQFNNYKSLSFVFVTDCWGGA